MDSNIPADDPVRLLSACVEGMDLSELYGTYDRVLKNQASPKQLFKVKDEEGIEFVSGSGKKKTPLQRSVEELEGYIGRLQDYAEKLQICGKRNSYSKTDHDATFMRLKEDAMLNGQLKPAYNLQHAVDSEYIVWADISARPTDTLTLKPFLQDMEANLLYKYREVVADAGYESEENYLFIEGNGQLSYIKPANYEISKTRKYKADIGRHGDREGRYGFQAVPAPGEHKCPGAEYHGRDSS